jgi:hypothetical protein
MGGKGGEKRWVNYTFKNGPHRPSKKKEKGERRERERKKEGYIAYFL